jgi:hypothetical protein
MISAKVLLCVLFLCAVTNAATWIFPLSTTTICRRKRDHHTASFASCGRNGVVQWWWLWIVLTAVHDAPQQHQLEGESSEAPNFVSRYNHNNRTALVIMRGQPSSRSKEMDYCTNHHRGCGHGHSGHVSYRARCYRIRNIVRFVDATNILH